MKQSKQSAKSANTATDKSVGYMKCTRCKVTIRREQYNQYLIDEHGKNWCVPCAEEAADSLNKLQKGGHALE